MKFKVTMKDPDTLYDAISYTASVMVETIEGISKKEKELLAESRCEELSKITEKWFEYGEYLTVEIDTEAQSIRVVPVSE